MTITIISKLEDIVYLKDIYKIDIKHYKIQYFMNTKMSFINFSSLFIKFFLINHVLQVLAIINLFLQKNMNFLI